MSDGSCHGEVWSAVHTVDTRVLCVKMVRCVTCEAMCFRSFVAVNAGLGAVAALALPEVVANSMLTQPDSKPLSYVVTNSMLTVSRC